MRFFSTAILTSVALLTSTANAATYAVSSSIAGCRTHCYCFPPIPGSGDVTATLVCGEDPTFTVTYCESVGTTCVLAPDSPLRRRSRVQRWQDAQASEHMHTNTLEKRTPTKPQKGNVSSSSTGEKKGSKAESSGSGKGGVKTKSIPKVTYKWLSKIPNINKMKLPAWLKKILDGKGKADQK